MERAASCPELGGVLDADAALALIDEWPAAPPDAQSDPVAFDKLHFDLPATLIMAQYVDFMTGRNAA